MKLDVSNMECDEAMMSIRFCIRTNKLTSGDSISVRSLSEPFWIRVTAWASAFDHVVSRELVTAGGWVAHITLN